MNRLTKAINRLLAISYTDTITAKAINGMARLTFVGFDLYYKVKSNFCSHPEMDGNFCGKCGKKLQ